MSKLGSGVTMIEVANFLGYYCNPIQLSRLVKHPNIPKWSRCHPVGYVGESKATQAEQEAWMDSLAWGFNMKSVLPMNTDAQTYGSAITLSQQDVWEYTGVTASQTTPGRLSDFRWCNDAAECPFLPVELYYYVPGVEYHYGPNIQLKWGKNLSQNVEIDPYNYNALRQGSYHILLRKLGATTGTTMLSTGVTDTFTAMTTSNITMESGDTGTYEVCAAIQKYGENHEVYPLPGTYMQFTVRNQTEEEYVGLRLTNQCYMTRSSTVGALYVKMQIQNLTNEAITAVINCRVYDGQSTPHRLWPVNNNNYTGETITIAAGGSATYYGTDNTLTATQQEPIRIEDIGNTVRPPVTADCTVYNTLKQGVTMTKSATILES